MIDKILSATIVLLVVLGPMIGGYVSSKDIVLTDEQFNNSEEPL